MKTKQNITQLNTKTQNDSSDSSASMSLHDTSLSSSDDDINLSELKKNNSTNSKEDKNRCVVCNEHYAKSKVEWYQCKICVGWAHESCGHKGIIIFFCQNCFSFISFLFLIFVWHNNNNNISVLILCFGTDFYKDVFVD